MPSLMTSALRIAVLVTAISSLIGVAPQQAPVPRPAGSPSTTATADCCASGKCTGSPTCSVCTNCSRCEWCKSGGTCGVCAPQHPPTSPPAPTNPPPAKVRGATSDSTLAATPAATEDGISVYFSPNGGCTKAIVEQLQSAKQSIKVLAYRLTSHPIEDALLAASKRGVVVSLVLDGAQQSERASDATYISEHGLSVLIDRVHAIAHNKVIIVDDGEVITGSFNFTNDAELVNAENLVIVQGKPKIAQSYLKDFERHVAHAVPYRPPSGAKDGGK